MFRYDVPVEVGEIVTREAFVFADLMLARRGSDVDVLAEEERLTSNELLLVPPRRRSFALGVVADHPPVVAKITRLFPRVRPELTYYEA